MPATSSGPSRTVLDASALVDALIGTGPGRIVWDRLPGRALHAPAHLDAEVLSALGRLHRAEELGAEAVATAIGDLRNLPLHRHPLPPLLTGAWNRRGAMRLADALYVELAAQLGDRPILSTDARLARASELVELVESPPPSRK